MSITVTKDFPKVRKLFPGFGLLSGSIAFDNSYPTGGEDASDISKYFTSVKNILFNQMSGYLFEYDITNDKIIVRAIKIDDQDGAAGVGVAVYFDDDGTLGARLCAVNAGDADSYEIIGEVPNTTDLSALTSVAFIAFGMI